jgi:hypothetical protein
MKLPFYPIPNPNTPIFNHFTASMSEALQWIRRSWQSLDPALRQGIKTVAYASAGVYAAKKIMLHYTDAMREEVVKPLGNQALSFWQRHQANDFCRQHRFYVTTFSSASPAQFNSAVKRLYHLLLDRQNHSTNLQKLLESDDVENLFRLSLNDQIRVRIRDADTARIWLEVDGSWTVGELYPYFVDPRYLIELYDPPFRFQYAGEEFYRPLRFTSTQFSDMNTRVLTADEINSRNPILKFYRNVEINNTQNKILEGIYRHFYVLHTASAATAELTWETFIRRNIWQDIKAKTITPEFQGILQSLQTRERKKEGQQDFTWDDFIKETWRDINDGR